MQPVFTETFPEVSGLLEVRIPDSQSRSIRYWLDSRYRVAIEPSDIVRLFLPALPGDLLSHIPEIRNKTLAVDVLGYDPEGASAVLHVRNSPNCYLCSMDAVTGAFSSQRVPLAAVTGFISSRRSLRSVSRAIDVVGAARNWLSKART